ncbi:MULTISPECIES: IS4 family transposase [Paenibacillaceae]|nr:MULTISPECIES: IS4 family transposase [Paenibacillaceae]MBU5445611.1 IS4 family transposase [Paenibacillus sp. MSJ-34]MBY0050523.1 IS4 family transposase [Brevibacillus agri]MCG5252452.1 IS4 family transposase [Brevibacillus agri]WHX29631.1 IS4 family transposase [Brevibacillus agri]WHX30536.1 IS4 family transposase [Brevibacillus agri]
MDKNTLFSSFGKWIAPINIVNFQQRIDETDQDKYVKKLTTKAYLLLFLHAQLQQREGLRAIADDVLSKEFQQELGLSSISPSQLSRKNNQVEPALLEEIFVDLVQQIQSVSGNTHSLRKDIKIIDSTTIGLCLQKYKWATFRKTKAGIKIHLRLVFANQEDVYPDKISLTYAKSNDRTQMESLIDEIGAMYVFDRGYVDYEKFDEYTDKGIFFASRLKDNAEVRHLHTFQLPPESTVLSDSMILLGTPQKRVDNVLRLIETLDSKGNRIRIITNRFDLEADELSDIYRWRWQIELFFKWLKQHVKIKTFYGTSDNAVRNQVFLALIAYCLLLLVKRERNSQHSLLQISRWLKVFLWQTFEQWIGRMDYQSKRTSRGRQKRN